MHFIFCESAESANNIIKVNWTLVLQLESLRLIDLAVILYKKKYVIASVYANLSSIGFLGSVDAHSLDGLKKIKQKKN